MAVIQYNRFAGIPTTELNRWDFEFHHHLLSITGLYLSYLSTVYHQIKAQVFISFAAF